MSRLKWTPWPQCLSSWMPTLQTEITQTCASSHNKGMSVVPFICVDDAYQVPPVASRGRRSTHGSIYLPSSSSVLVRARSFPVLGVLLTSSFQAAHSAMFFQLIWSPFSHLFMHIPAFICPLLAALHEAASPLSTTWAPSLRLRFFPAFACQCCGTIHPLLMPIYLCICTTNESAFLSADISVPRRGSIE